MSGVLAFPIWVINGLLVTLYWLVGHLPELVSLSVVLLLAFGIAPVLQRRAVARVRRYGRGEAMTGRATAMWFTLAAGAAWLLASLVSKPPIPVIGMFMWLAAAGAVLLVSEERMNVLWWANSGMVTYAVAVVTFRYGMALLGRISPAAWAAAIGSVQDAEIVLENTRANLAMIGMVAVFVLYPLGYVGLLFNRLLRNPKPLYNSFLEAGEVLARMRDRQ